MSNPFYVPEKTQRSLDHSFHKYIVLGFSIGILIVAAFVYCIAFPEAMIAISLTSGLVVIVPGAPILTLLCLYKLAGEEYYAPLILPQAAIHYILVAPLVLINSTIEGLICNTLYRFISNSMFSRIFADANELGTMQTQISQGTITISRIS